MEIGLYYYNARYYAPTLARFISADTLVPDPQNPQSFNRYSYVENRPLNFNDPTGHIACNTLGTEQCDQNDNYINASNSLVSFDAANSLAGIWDAAEIQTVYQAAHDIGTALANHINEKTKNLSLYGEAKPHTISPEEAFIMVYGETITFRKMGQSCAEAFGNDTYSCFGSSNGNTINIYTNAEGYIVGNHRFIVHELGHSFERAVGNSLPSRMIIQTQDTTGDIFNRDGFAGPFPGWQQSIDNSAGEIFADMFIGWVYGEWETDPITGQLPEQAGLKSNFMTANMSTWISVAVSR